MGKKRVSLRKRLLNKIAPLALGLSLAYSPMQAQASPNTKNVPTQKKDYSMVVESIDKNQFKTLEDRLEANSGWIAQEMATDVNIHNDILRAGDKEVAFSGLGSGLANLMPLIFPNIPGTSRVMFMPAFGKNKMHNPDIKWEECESAHFELRTYGNDFGGKVGKACDINKDDPLASHMLSFMETNFKEFWDMFKFGEFKTKQGAFIYNNRRDYEQSNMMYQFILENTLGFMDPRLNFDYVMPFDGDWEQFFETAKHEQWHQITMQVGKGENVPRWFAEGSADYIGDGKRDPVRDRVVRDIVMNAPEFHVSQVERFGFHPITYIIGSSLTQYIADNWGEDKIIDLWKRSKYIGFDKNLKKTLGISRRQLYNGWQTSKEELVAPLRHQKGLEDISSLVMTQNLLAADGMTFASLDYKNGQAILKLNRLNKRRGKVSTEVLKDGRMGNQAFGWRPQVDIDNNQLVYVVKNAKTDELRTRNFSFKRGKFKVGKEKSTSFKGVTKISDPVIMDKHRVAFVGIGKKYANIFVYNSKSNEFTQITEDDHFYSDLDFNDDRLVFSKSTKNRAHESHLHMMSLTTDSDGALRKGKTKQLTSGKGHNQGAKFSPDGSKIIFDSDKTGVRNLFVYDTNTGRTNQLGSAEVTARNAHWTDDDSIFFNGVNLFAPLLYHLDIPHESTLKASAIARTVPSPSEHFFTKDGDNFTYVGDVVTKDETKSGDLTEKDGRLQFRHNKKNYRTVQLLPLEDRVLMLAVPDRKKPIGRELAYFEYSNGTVRRTGWLGQGLENFLESNPDVKKKLDEVRKKYTVIDEVYSPTDNHILITTNNKLSMEDHDKAISAYLLNTDTLKLSPLFDVKQLAKVGTHFLSDNKLLVIENPEKWVKKMSHGGMNGTMVEYDAYKKSSSRYVIYDYSKKESREPIFSGTMSHRVISKDRRFVVAFSDKGKKVMVYDAKTGKEKVIRFAKKGKRDNLQFVGHKLFYTEKSKSKVTVHTIDLDKGTKTKVEEIKGLPRGKLLGATYNGDQAALVFQKKKSKAERLYLFDADADKPLKRLSKEGVDFGAVRFIGDTLVYRQRTVTNQVSFQSHGGMEGKAAAKVRLTNGSLFYTDGRDVFEHSLSNGKTTKTAANSFGFDANDNFVLYSKFNPKGTFEVFARERSSGKEKKLGEGFAPKRVGDKFVFYHKKDGVFSFTSAEIKSLDDVVLKEFSKEGTNFFNVRNHNGKIAFNTKKAKAKAKDSKAEKRSFAQVKYKTNEVSTIPWDRKSFSGWGAVGYGNGSFAGWLSANMVLTDKPLDHIAYANIMTNFDTFWMVQATYADVKKDRAATAYYRKLWDVSTAGARGIKLFPQNKFLRYNLVGGYEYRKWEFSSNDHVALAGLSLSYDTSTWGLHGPRNGARAFISTELGFSIAHQDIGNVDANFDLRKYWQTGRKSGFACRAAGGTSQGKRPRNYLLGGAEDIKGVGLFSLDGQNYGFASCEYRLPLAQVVGAILPEQVVGASMFTTAWEVEGKIFGYVGDIFDNDEWSTDRLKNPEWGIGYGARFYWLGMPWQITHNPLGKNKSVNIWFLYPDW